MFVILQPALTIFLMRVVDVTLYTLRINMVMRGRKALAWFFAFCQSFVYVSAIRVVITDLDNWLNLIGYAAGFATGNVVGMYVEGRLSVGYTHLRIVSPGRGMEIVERLREEGYGVTEVSGNGQEGAVAVINCNIRRREHRAVCRMIDKIDDQAFVTAQNVRLVWRGTWHASPSNPLHRLKG